ncbi:nuclear cap-binding protein subunit 3-like [Leptopilina boulardi]|uniref:nuclear cap-binding protein subunit 3-like n=1 Tax=Leptopilina boulardi TaxID=63433 RepID=UPI0021F648CC|nr:nuclear cap-binding protein subunit 3-like [Leptopilina boulardi]
MNQEFEPMEVEEDASNFDELIESELKSNSESPISREIQSLPEARYENRGGAFLTGIDIFSEEGKQKIEERAKRFGLNDKEIFSRLQEYQDLYTSMGITEENENTKNFRLNALHIRGTEEMSTKDVFKYFEDYAPASLEWINDVSCNVVWLDSASAARALVGLSKKIIGLNNRNTSESNEINFTQKENEEENIDDTNNVKNSNDIEIHVKDIEYPLPPGIWRKGINYSKSKGIFMRFATRTDKKQPRAEKMSEYYKKYGNPNFGGVKGILTESRKRTYRHTTQNKKKGKGHSSDEEMNVSVKKNPWGDLSQNWGVGDTVEEEFTRKQPFIDQSSHIKERLGLKNRLQEKLHESEESESESCSESEDEWFKKSKIPRMRMRADDEEAKVKKRRSQQRKQETLNIHKDLRSRLGKVKKEPVRDAIQIVITNYENSRAQISEEEEGEILESECDEQEIENEEEQEEGEIEDVVEENEDDEETEKEEGEDSDNGDEEDELSEKEVRGPKGSVIKVVARKPQIASTVWTRLHRTAVKSEVKAVNNSSKRTSRRDLRETLRGDLRSRLGSHSRTKGRSPLRIEVKNDKCANENSGSE